MYVSKNEKERNRRYVVFFLWAVTISIGMSVIRMKRRKENNSHEREVFVKITKHFVLLFFLLNIIDHYVLTYVRIEHNSNLFYLSSQITFILHRKKEQEESNQTSSSFVSSLTREGREGFLSSSSVRISRRFSSASCSTSCKRLSSDSIFARYSPMRRARRVSIWLSSSCTSFILSGIAAWSCWAVWAASSSNKLSLRRCAFPRSNNVSRADGYSAKTSHKSCFVKQNKSE